MAAKTHHPRRRLAFFLVAIPIGLCLLITLISALSNIGLPGHSVVVDHLTTPDKARLAEATHLRATLGDGVWPGWGQTAVPFIVYNETNAFLVDYPAAVGGVPVGWVKMPQGQARGVSWQLVAADAFDGQPYYGQMLQSPDQTPEGFTVLVGDVWVATFQTKDYAQISFVTGLHTQLPPLIRELVPYRLLWGLLMGESEGYMSALLHETFHAYQAAAAPDRFQQAETVMTLEGRYPWDAAPTAWRSELDLLASAAQAETQAEALDLARRFLVQRDQRRAEIGLSPDLIDFERQREWLEGLAKYAELDIERQAATSGSYQPVPTMAQDPEFNHYRTRAAFWSEQLGEVRRILNQEGEIRFYYTGLAQAAVLDRLLPGWKESVFTDGVWLEDLLRQAVTQP